MNDVTRALAAMFEDSPRNADRHLPMYRHDAALGAKSWWPPLCQVWAQQGIPDDDDTTAPHWPEAWALLRGLHEQFLASKGAI